MHASLTLRKIEISDLDQIMVLEALGFTRPGWKGEAPDTFRDRLLAFPDGFWGVSGPDGRLYGYLCSEIWNFNTVYNPDQFKLNHDASKSHVPEGNELCITSFTVDPEVRGKGIGTGLFNGAIENIYKQYSRLISSILMVNETWVDAVKIYKSAGFLEIGEIGDYYSAGVKALVMRKMK